MSDLSGILRNPLGWILWEIAKKKNDPEVLRQEADCQLAERKCELSNDQLANSFTLRLLNEEQKRSFEQVLGKYLNGEITKKEYKKVKKNFESLTR